MPGYVSRIGPSDDDRVGDGLAVRLGFGVTDLVAVAVAVGDAGTTTGEAELTTGTGDCVNALGTAVDSHAARITSEAPAASNPTTDRPA